MNIVWTRRISQPFFLILFFWFSFATVFGTKWFQLRGWPVNLFLELDPLVAIGTILTTHTLYKGLIWALLTLLVTIVFGRVFCGWVCPFGTMHHFFGWIGSYKRGARVKMEKNRYRKWQALKYYILAAFLVMAAFPIATSSTLITGLLDPIPFVTRATNLSLMPIADGLGLRTTASPRHYDHATLIGFLFLSALLANLAIPRFYCRVLCPTGALLGIFSRFTLWRIAKKSAGCSHCEMCESHCEGAADPALKPRIAECLVCMNCVDNYCNRDLITYRNEESVEGDIPAPQISRRGLLLALGSGAMSLPMLHLGDNIGSNYSPKTIRPPGSLAEEDFVQRCIKCGQCMKVCPTNIIMPAGLGAGLEGIWTPVLNFRIGTSGCQLNCVACSHVCPTAAIRSLTLDEKHGTGNFKEAGPIRLGTAFVDRGRCLPWAMGTPCLVCEENCPVTPKAIHVNEFMSTMRNGQRNVVSVSADIITLDGPPLAHSELATGDYYLQVDGPNTRPLRIATNDANTVSLSSPIILEPGQKIELQVRLGGPVVDPDLCIGCGVCEHECPVSGLRAIRVSSENESRNKRSKMKIRRVDA